MKPEEIDSLLAKAANRSDSPLQDRAAIESVKSAILSDLSPVRPLAPARTFALAFLCIFAVIAAAAASALGLHGIHALSGAQIAVIFPMILVAGTLAAVACAREMRPAAGLRLGGFALIFATLVFPGIFSLLFSDRRVGNFVAEGIPCLVAGLCVAIPTGFVSAWILRRGFVLDRSMAGIAVGTLSGLAGLGMLEMHCPILKVLHVIVWHMAVVLISGIFGFTIGKIWPSRRAGMA